MPGSERKSDSPPTGELAWTIRDTHDRVVKLDHALHGGDTPERGLIVRVDRIERENAVRREQERGRKSLMLGVTGSVILLGIKAVWDYISTGSHPPSH